MSDATHLLLVRAALLLVLGLACWGLGAWVTGRAGARRLLAMAVLFALGLALGTAAYAAVDGGLPDRIDDGAMWRELVAAVLGDTHGGG